MRPMLRSPKTIAQWAEWVTTALNTTGVYALYHCPDDPNKPDVPFLRPFLPETPGYKGRAFIVASDPDLLSEEARKLNASLEEHDREPDIDVVFMSFAHLMGHIKVYNQTRGTRAVEVGGLIMGKRGYVLTETAAQALGKAIQPSKVVKRLVLDVTGMACPVSVWDLAWAEIERDAEAAAEQARTNQQTMIPMFLPQGEQEALLQ